MQTTPLFVADVRRPGPLLPIVGTLLTAAAVAVGGAAAFLLSLDTSIHCGESTPPEGAALRLRLGLLAIATFIAAVPATVGLIARVRSRPWVPWAVVAAGLFGFGHPDRAHQPPHRRRCF